jgi:hypothetical protein
MWSPLVRHESNHANKQSIQAPKSNSHQTRISRSQTAPIVILSRFPTPAPNKALQAKCLGEPHEMVGVLDDN